jgi:hypothetical protein
VKKCLVSRLKLEIDLLFLPQVTPDLAASVHAVKRSKTPGTTPSSHCYRTEPEAPAASGGFFKYLSYHAR